MTNQPRITTAPDFPGQATIHLPEYTSWDTQAGACEVGIPVEDLPGLRDAINKHLGARTTPDNPAASSDGLREQLVAAIRDAACTRDEPHAEEECVRERIQPVVYHSGVLAEVSGTPEQFATAVLAVRDRRMEQLTAGRATWKAKAAEIERDRDRLAAVLREVLDQFAIWPAGGTFWPEPGVVAKVSAEEWDRWDAALDGPADTTPPHTPAYHLTRDGHHDLDTPEEL